MERYSIINGQVHYIEAHLPKSTARFCFTF